MQRWQRRAEIAITFGGVGAGADGDCAGKIAEDGRGKILGGRARDGLHAVVAGEPLVAAGIGLVGDEVVDAGEPDRGVDGGVLYCVVLFLILSGVRIEMTIHHFFYFFLSFENLFFEYDFST